MNAQVALRRKDGQLLVHLLNSAGMQVSAEYVAGDFIPPIGPLRVNIRLPAEPKRVRLEPGGQPLPGRYSGGTWSATLDRLEMHEIVAVDI